MKKIIWILIAIVVIALVWWGVAKKKTPVVEAEHIKIGVAVSLTGYAANWGEGEVKAIQLALDNYKDKINQPVDLVIEDTKTTDVGTVSAVKKLIEIDHVQAIIGPTWADSFQGSLPIAENAKVATLSPSAAIETLKDKSKFTYFFSTWLLNAPEVNIVIDSVVKNKGTKLDIVTDEDPFDIDFANTFAEAANAIKPGFTGLKTTVPIGTNDFRTQIAKIKADKPTTIFVQLQDTSLVGPFIKQLKEQKVTAQVYASHDMENTDNLKKFPGYFDGVMYAFPSYDEDPSYATLLQKFQSKFGADASQGPSFVNAYNAATMVFEVLSTGARTGTEIRDGLAKVHVSGIGTKDLSFDANGQVQGVTFVMKTIKDNKFVELAK